MYCKTILERFNSSDVVNFFKSVISEYCGKLKAFYKFYFQIFPVPTSNCKSLDCFRHNTITCYEIMKICIT